MQAKLNLPTVLTATYKIITPMFIGDAELKATAINPQSFKGVLRFWWRALKWGEIRSQLNSDAAALKELHHQEALLFGSIAANPNSKKADETYGRGKFALKLIEPKCLETQPKGNVHEILKNYTGARYLGYGVIEAFRSKTNNTETGQLLRDCIDENQEFKVVLLINDNSIIAEICKALKLIGLLGGLGSKARKGYGSLNLLDINCAAEATANWSAPQTVAAYKQEICSLFANINNCEIPPISAFSRNTFIEIINKKLNVYVLLDDYGKAMMMYRSWGNNGKVLNEAAELNFKDDHGWSKHPDTFRKDFHPRRIIFGMPHSYGKISYKGESIPFLVGSDMAKPDKSGKGHGRRASPLFFHIQQLGNEFIGVAYILRAQFLPETSKINAHTTTVNQKIEWDILLDKFLLDKGRFPHAEVIFGGAK